MVVKRRPWSRAKKNPKDYINKIGRGYSGKLQLNKLQKKSQQIYMGWNKRIFFKSCKNPTRKIIKYICMSKKRRR